MLDMVDIGGNPNMGVGVGGDAFICELA